MGRSLLLQGKGIFFTDEFPFGTKVCATLTEATAYASGHPLAFAGQLVSVTAGGTSDVYVIEPNRTLRSIGDSGQAGGNGTLTAYHLPFDAGGFTNVGDALASLFYVRPTVSLTGGGTYEIGQTVSSVTLNWSIGGSHPPVSQSLNNGIGNITPLTTRTYTHSGQTITANRTYTITVSDGTNTATSSTTVAFSPKRYWGVSDKATLSDTDILALSSEFSTNRNQTRTLDCSGGRYLWFVWESGYGEGSFTLNGLPNTAFTPATRTMVNASGATRSVLLTRSDNLLYGDAYTLVVS
jgi:hypothetical protein